MAALNQDFVTYQGDDVAPIFTVRDSAGAVVDISGATQITWSVRRQATDADLLTITKTGGGITFVTDGTDGQFQVLVTSADTAALNGFYLHFASLTSAAGAITTVAVGRMQVGLRPSWTYDPTAIADNQVYQVRRLIGDVIADDQQIFDAEISFALTQRSSVYGAAADCCRYIASQYSRKVDTVVPGEIRTMYSAQATKYLRMATEFDILARARGAGITPYAGGISISDKQTVASNSDRVAPSFDIGLDDNLIVPVGPVGQQSPTIPAPLGTPET